MRWQDNVADGRQPYLLGRHPKPSSDARRGCGTRDAGCRPPVHTMYVVRYLQALSDPATQLSPHLPNFLPPPRPPAACRPAANAQMRNRDRGLVIGDRIINSDAEISSSPNDRVMPDHTAPEAKEMVMWSAHAPHGGAGAKHAGNPAILGSQASRHQCWGCCIASHRGCLVVDPAPRPLPAGWSLHQRQQT